MMLLSRNELFIGYASHIATPTFKVWGVQFSPESGREGVTGGIGEQ